MYEGLSNTSKDIFLRLPQHRAEICKNILCGIRHMDAVALFKADKRSRLIPAGDESVSVLSCRQQLCGGE